MHPIFFKIGDFAIYSYGVVLSVAIVLGILLASYLGTKRRFDPAFVVECGFWMVIFGLLGARILYCAQHLEDFSDNYWQMLNLRSAGISIQGAIIGGFGAMFVSFRRGCGSGWSGLDIYAAPALLGMGIGRIGCVLQGCCYGQVCSASLPWGIVYPAALGIGTAPRHPSQIYELLMDFALMALVIFIYKRRVFCGQAFWAVIGGYGIIRFTSEFFRESPIVLGLSPAQWFSMLFFLVGLLGYLGVFGTRPVPDEPEGRGRMPLVEGEAPRPASKKGQGGKRKAKKR